jgi:hypothetical protein
MLKLFIFPIGSQTKPNSKRGKLMPWASCEAKQNQMLVKVEI